MTTFRAPCVRLCAVWLFLALVVTVSVQHHVAQTDLNDDPICTIQNDDVDGDEILTRLVLADDLVMPKAPLQGAVVQWLARVDTAAYVFPPDRSTVGSRAPPLELPSV